MRKTLKNHDQIALDAVLPFTLMLALTVQYTFALAHLHFVADECFTAQVNHVKLSMWNTCGPKLLVRKCDDVSLHCSINSHC